MPQPDLNLLLNKYDKPIPRYTSYPTVPYWDFEGFSLDSWKARVVDIFKKENEQISLYIHLPFCEHLCTFCACNKRITVNHKVEDPYITAVLKEWRMYLQLLQNKPVIKEIHLGGGTPTFFSPEQLGRLIQSITKDAVVADEHEFSLEVHPNFTTEQHLKTLADLGFNRISLGVQDFDPQVQYIINRPQSFEVTEEVINWARKHGYESINIDLIFGLPKQSLESIKLTVDKVNLLNPDRIAFYSYAHVPWKSKGQRRYEDDDVPKAMEKWQMYQYGRKLLMENDFVPIGMDHFAKSSDKMFKAFGEGNLHRNFMGYTTTDNKLLIGLGCSSISDAWGGFAQNNKVVEEYQELVHQDKFPIENGHILNEEDLTIRQLILDLMCRGKALIPANVYTTDELKAINSELDGCVSDGLLKLEEGTLTILPAGETFIRNICSIFDIKLRRKANSAPTFSRSI